jgi:uncharacterized protein
MKSEKVLKNSIKGCRTFVEESKGRYQGEFDISLGPIQDVFSLEIRQLQEKMPTYYRLRIKGKGNLGEIQGEADLFLKEDQSTTKLAIHAEIQLTGTLAMAEKQIVDGELNRLIESFFQRLEREMKRGIYYSRKAGRRH